MNHRNHRHSWKYIIIMYARNVRFCLCAGWVCWILSSCVHEQNKSLSVFSSGEQGSEEMTTYDLPEIQNGGELIVLTLYGPASYFEFRGEDFGNQFKLAEEFAKSIGVSIRVDVCRTPAEMVDKLVRGEADLIAYPMETEQSSQGDSSEGGLLDYCGEEEITHLMDTLATVQRDAALRPKGQRAWAVRASSPQLSESLKGWLAQNEPQFLALSQPKVHGHSGNYHYHAPARNTAAPVRNLAKGEISVYDALFKRYSSHCGWDWRLLAAQAYEESAFNPNAVSWAGAMGLMQLMPQTARDLGVTADRVYDAESNISGAVRLIRQLNDHYLDVRSEDERINFILAAYNAGPGHVDDARRLAEKKGYRSYVWADVAPIVLRMSQSEYYNDPVVRHGYFRGTETYNYVADIRARWTTYRNKIH